MVDKNGNNFDDSDDILALLQDYTDADFASDELDESNHVGKGLLDDMELDNTDDDLLALLDMIAEQDQTEPADNNIDALVEEEQSLGEDFTYQNEDSNDDILALNDLWDEELDLSLDESFHEDSNYGESNSLGDIFSDVLSAINPEKETDVSQRYGENTSMSEKEMMSTKDEGIKAPKKKGLFSKLFKEDKETTTALEEQNLKEKTSEKKKEAKKKKVKATEKAKKQSTDNTKKENKKASSKKEKKVVEKKVVKKKPVKPKKIKNKIGENIIKEVQELDVNEKPLNKKLLVALSAMMLSIGILIVFGTRAYTVSLNISNATTNFERKRYTEAYNELYGIARNSKNQDIYDKVMTVMYVNKHLNTYNNYYALELYPESVDSLIKGLQRYEQYIDKASTLGVESDLDNIKSTILKELDTKFNVNEKNAIKLAKVEDKKEYSKKIYSIVSNRIVASNMK